MKELSGKEIERVRFLIRRVKNKTKEAERQAYEARLAIQEVEEILKELFSIK